MDAKVARKTMRSLSQQVLDAFDTQEREALRDIMPYFIQAQVAKYSKQPKGLFKTPPQYSRVTNGSLTLDNYFKWPLVANGFLTLDHVMNVLGIKENNRTRTFNTVVKLVAPNLIISTTKGKRGGKHKMPSQLELTFMGFICACQVHRNPRAQLVQRLAARCTELVCTQLVKLAVDEAREDVLRNNSKILKFGQYRGEAFYTVWKRDPGYCKWVSESSAGTRAFRDFQSYVVDQMTQGL